jgi:hypothetical protein
MKQQNINILPSINYSDYLSKLQEAGILNNRIKVELYCIDDPNKLTIKINIYLKLKEKIQRLKRISDEKKVPINFNFDEALQNLDKISPDLIEEKITRLFQEARFKKKEAEKRVKERKKEILLIKIKLDLNYNIKMIDLLLLLLQKIVLEPFLAGYPEIKSPIG